MNNKRIYFPGLNGVRFLAAFLVLIDHLELFKNLFGYKTLWPNSTSSNIGSIGVTVFFVLSGYLITYLLLAEKDYSRINLKNFYIRRILRIWPLYYLIVLLSFFIIPNIDFFDVPQYTHAIEDKFGLKLSLFSFLLANVAFVYLPNVAYANILWSVAVEEQFYLIWPNIIKYFKNTLSALLFFLSCYLILKISVRFDFFNIQTYLPNKIGGFIDRTRISCMIIGGIGALIVFKKNKVLIKVVFLKFIQISAIIIFLIILSNYKMGGYFSLIKNELVSLMVIIILINVSTNKQSILKLENKYLNYLGKISYGIYVYHLFAVVICIKLFSNVSLMTIPYYLWSFILLVSVTLLTVLFSHLSYKYIEVRFLKMKKKYSVLLSGDSIKNL